MAKGPQAEYTNLVSYFKHLVWLTFGALTVVVAAGGYVFYTNMRDLRADVTAAATKIATDESHRAVANAFDEKNITQQIQEAAHAKIGTITDQMIEQQITSKLQPIQKRTLMIGRISESQARARLGIRSGLDELNAIIRNTKDQDTLEFAQSTLATVAQDYDATWSHPPAKAPQTTWLDFLKIMVPGTGGKPPQNLAGVVEEINTSDNLNTVAIATFAFRDLTGEKIKMFDIDAVHRWCANHEPKCK